jgi:acetylornithine deacetylase
MYTDLKNKILQQIEEDKFEIISLLQEMVKIPSVTHPPIGDEGPVQKFISSVFYEMGLEVDIFEPTKVSGLETHEGYWPGLNYDGRPNVVGVLRGCGGGRDLILNGHCDVVPPGPETLWADHPFSGKVYGNRLFGRGAVDMKGGIVAMTMAVNSLKKCGIELSGDVILESVVNEELGGYNGTLACIVKGYEADAAIVTEPTDLKIEPATKGGQAYRISITGRGAHASFWWEGVSALDKAIFIKKAIEEFSVIRQKQTANSSLYSDLELFPTPALTDCVYSLQSGSPDIMGVPHEASMDLMIDVLPGESLDAVKQDFENFIIEAASKDQYLKEYPPKIERANMRDLYPTQIGLDNPIINILHESFKDVKLSEPKICGFESACDAMMFNLYSKTPALVFGPGQLKLAHRPDEYMDLVQLIDGVKILALTIVDFCGYIEN